MFFLLMNFFFGFFYENVINIIVFYYSAMSFASFFLSFVYSFCFIIIFTIINTWLKTSINTENAVSKMISHPFVYYFITHYDLAFLRVDLLKINFSPRGCLGVCLCVFICYRCTNSIFIRPFSQSFKIFLSHFCHRNKTFNSILKIFHG